MSIADDAATEMRLRCALRGGVHRTARGVVTAVAAALAVSSQPASATQTCDVSRYAMSTPATRFDDHGDGTMTDRSSKLMWMRCAVGQRWSAGACEGAAARLDWGAAQAAAADVNRRGAYFFNDWRLPQVQELASIAERQCNEPRINLALFPDTPADFFWTGSSGGPTRGTNAAFALSFGEQGVRYEDKGEANHVRLVRRAD